MIDPKTKQSILAMRQQGASFLEIADLFSLSSNTVKSICYRSGIRVMPIEKQEADTCKNCGRPLTQTPGAKKKVFCSARCRTDWWNKSRSRHPYRLTCCYCGKEFISFGNRKKKFCGRECYRLSQYGEGLP